MSLARIKLWSDVQPGATVLLRNSYVQVEEVEGPVEGQMLIRGKLKFSGASREWNFRGSDMVAVLVSSQEKAQMFDFFRKVFDG